MNTAVFRLRPALLGLAILSTAGCSTVWDKTVDYTSRAAASVGDTLHPVEVKPLAQSDDDTLQRAELRQLQDRPPTLENWQMDHKAREICPKGYVREHAYAHKTGGRFGYDDLSCTTGDCTYQLVWIVRCDDVPQEPFSIFGKY